MKDVYLSEFDRIRRHISIFTEIGKTLTSALTVNEVLEKIFYKVAELFSPENWSLLLVDEERQELYFEIVVGTSPHAHKLKDIRLKIGEGVAGWVAKTGRPLFVPSVDKEPRFTRKGDEATHFSTESIICIPLKIRDRVLGVIELVNKKDIEDQHQYDFEILTTVADYAAIALENARNYEQVRKLTITDDTTGLYNARYLHEVLQLEIDRAQQRGTACTVIFFDLDNFKSVNDTHGHLIGSQLLGEIGKLLASHLPPRFYGARYGGDEFVIIMPETAREEGYAFCKKIRQALNNEKFLAREGLNISITASFGIATFPVDADTKCKILSKADERMYKIKDSHKNDIACD
ncbi:MAG: sensor domain-containing diguanylate cyclase [Desulfobacterota bacterium]|nr:sensor domain-containing diguanylate cyclase [Thermodesulfobacteriota bacterium]